MGSYTSSLAKSPSKEEQEKLTIEKQIVGVRGHTVTTASEIQADEKIAARIFDVIMLDENFSEEESKTESESEEESDDEELAERLLILEDAKKLKVLATAFLHPELPIQMDHTATARCYFDRPSAPEQEDVEEAEERAQILADATALKKLAVDYAHPEIGVVTTDSAVCGRNYFDRASGPEQESKEETEERLVILQDMQKLREAAIQYLHPEVGVVTNDSTACGRNFFDRPSASEQETVDESEERAQILAEAAALKKLAVDYAHPEIGVVTNDSSACGRNYFGRPSAPRQETEEEAKERAQILAIAAALKKLAVDYAHPEIGVITTDSSTCGRNFFDRPSAPQQDTEEEAEERAQILAEAAALKKLAVDYAHPEIGVITTDSSTCGRNFFDRPSAPQQESKEEAEERAQILADTAALKKLAVDYAHPEIGVVTIDATACARCYFDRASAPQNELAEEAKAPEEEKVSAPKFVVSSTKAPPTKTIPAFTKEQQDIVHSPSAVQLFGLGEDNGDAF